MNSLRSNFQLQWITILSRIAILTLAIIAIASDILIAFNCQSAMEYVYNSLAKINYSLSAGWLIVKTSILRFYTLHIYVLSLGAISLSIVHLTALVIRERKRNILLQQLEKLVAPIVNNLSIKVENVSN